MLESASAGRQAVTLSGAAATAPVREKAADLPTGHETILLVEDDARLRRPLSRRLRSLGYQVFEAENGPAALAQLAAAPGVDLIFTDMTMPGGMNGFEVAKAAQAMKPALKVLFTSGYADPGLARLGLQRGAWLKKPYSAEELALTIREVLNQPTGAPAR